MPRVCGRRWTAASRLRCLCNVRRMVKTRLRASRCTSTFPANRSAPKNPFAGHKPARLQQRHGRPRRRRTTAVLGPGSRWRCGPGPVPVRRRRLRSASRGTTGRGSARHRRGAARACRAVPAANGLRPRPRGGSTPVADRRNRLVVRHQISCSTELSSGSRANSRCPRRTGGRPSVSFPIRIRQTVGPSSRYSQS